MKIGFYHEGTAPSDKVRKALAAKHIRLMGRNSTMGFEVEDFELVVIDGSESAREIGDVYAAKGVDVQSIEDFLEGDKPAKPAAKKEEFNPDLPAKKKAAGTQPAKPAAKK